MIETAESYFTQLNTARAKQRLNQHEAIARMGQVSFKKLRAFINYSRWIIMCPNCNNGEFLFGDQLFYCTLCRNELIGGKLYKVIMPKSRATIEGILNIRPIINRNWQYPETVDDLAKENKEHGLDSS